MRRAENKSRAQGEAFGAIRWEATTVRRGAGEGDRYEVAGNPYLQYMYNTVHVPTFAPEKPFRTVTCAPCSQATHLPSGRELLSLNALYWSTCDIRFVLLQ